MKKIIISILITGFFLFPSIGLSIPSIDDPQIIDDTGDAFGYIDIESIWFFEDENNPDFLFVSMKIADPSEFTFQQTFAFFWTHKDVQYSCSLHLGFDFFEWKKYRAGKYEWEDQDVSMINGSYNFNSGIITWKIPKTLIGNPQAGDVLTDTWSNAFRRLGVIGRIGFTRTILDQVIYQILGNSMWDYAPERGSFGNDYSIQY